MTDAELLQRLSAARGRAHRAPLAEYSKDHRGHTAIVNHTTGWRSEGAEFIELCEMAEKRGLSMPPCDCPAGSHDWEKK